MFVVVDVAVAVAVVLIIVNGVLLELLKFCLQFEFKPTDPTSNRIFVLFAPVFDDVLVGIMDGLKFNAGFQLDIPFE